MLKYKTIECHSPDCTNIFRVRSDGKHATKYCKTCKQTHPLKVLKLQTEYEMPIPELLVYVSRMFNFKSGEAIAGVLKVFRNVLIQWLDIYLGVKTWEEFYKKYQCKSNCCYIMSCSDLYGGQYQNKYYLIQKLKKDLETCTCLYKSGTTKDQILVKLPNEGHLQKLMEVSMNTVKLVELDEFKGKSLTPVTRTPVLRTPKRKTAKRKALK